MSIKERLEGKPLDRRRTIATPQRDSETYAYIDGKETLIRAKIPMLLQELYEAVSDKSPDIHLAFPLEKSGHLPNQWNNDWEHLQGFIFGMEDGNVGCHVRWNYSPHLQSRYSFNEMKLLAVPYVRDIIVVGREKEYVNEAQWGAGDGKFVLEDAIVLAFNDPFRFQNIHLLGDFSKVPKIKVK
jgi:hypothetical protein